MYKSYFVTTRVAPGYINRNTINIIYPGWHKCNRSAQRLCNLALTDPIAKPDGQSFFSVTLVRWRHLRYGFEVTNI